MVPRFPCRACCSQAADTQTASRAWIGSRGWRLDFAGRDRAANADDRVCGCLAGEVLSSDSCAGWLDGRSRPRCWPARGAALNRCLVMVGAEHGEKWVGSFTTSARRACLRAMDRTIDLPASGWYDCPTCSGMRHPYPWIAEQSTPMLPFTRRKALVRPISAGRDPTTCQYRLAHAARVLMVIW